MIYLDYAASTPVCDEVLTAFNEAVRHYYANPNSSHILGATAKKRVDECSKNILSLLNVPEYEIIYTSGASESNNLAVKGVAEKNKNRGKHIITTMLEHSSVNGAAAYLKNTGFEIDYVSLNSDGIIDTEHLKELMRNDTVLVSVCAVDSEVGTRQPIEKISELISKYPNCFFHVDATQAVGKISVPIQAADLLTFAPHKFYGLNGSGAIVKKKEVMLEPLIHGGISTTPYRSGTPDLALIIALEKALTIACKSLNDRYKYVMDLNTKLREALKKYRTVKINSSESCVPYILNISIPGINIGAFISELEKHDVILSSKPACCAPNTVSHAVYAMTNDRKRSLSTIRISLSHLTVPDEIEQFLSAFDKCLTDLKA